MNGRLNALENNCDQNESVENKLFARAQSEYIDSYIKFKCHVEAREVRRLFTSFLPRTWKNITSFWSRLYTATTLKRHFYNILITNLFRLPTLILHSRGFGAMSTLEHTLITSRVFAQYTHLRLVQSKADKDTSPMEVASHSYQYRYSGFDTIFCKIIQIDCPVVHDYLHDV